MKIVKILLFPVVLSECEASLLYLMDEYGLKGCENKAGRKTCRPKRNEVKEQEKIAL